MSRLALLLALLPAAAAAADSNSLAAALEARVRQRRAGEVEAALTSLTLQRGAPPVAPGPLERGVLTGLHLAGWLARPSAPGEGSFSLDAEGRVRPLEGPAPPLRARPSAAHLARAVQARLPGALEFALPRLERRAQAVLLGRLAPLEPRPDPWASDAILEALEGLRPPLRRARVLDLQGFLRDLVRQGEPGQRWRAAGLLHEARAPGLPEIPETDWPELLAQVARHRIPLAALEAALEQAPARGELFLLGRLLEGRPAEALPALRVLARVATPRCLPLLRRLRAQPGPLARMLGHRLDALLASLTAGDRRGD